MKLPKLTAALLLSVTAACGADTPLDPPSRTAALRLDGGVMYGSGNRAGEADSTTSAQSGDAAPSVEAASAPGGVMYGSGN